MIIYNSIHACVYVYVGMHPLLQPCKPRILPNAALRHIRRDSRQLALESNGFWVFSGQFVNTHRFRKGEEGPKLYIYIYIPYICPRILLFEDNCLKYCYIYIYIVLSNSHILGPTSQLDLYTKCVFCSQSH